MNYESINWENLNSQQNYLIMEGEVWKTSRMINIKMDSGKHYQVSNYGRVRRSDTKFVYKITDNGNGYKKAALSYGIPKTVNFYIHRLVADEFLDNPNNLPQVNHKPSGLGKFDNRAIHLEWCTEKDNIKDAHENGQMVNRTIHNTKIDRKSDKFIAEMYRQYKETGMVGETAKAFGVSRTTLSSIVNKRSRRKVTDPLDLEYNKESNQ